MHRQTPLTAGFVGYTSGGARALVDVADDEKGMQEMKGSMMFGEARTRIESPQNYGFTSVVLPAKKDKDGQIVQGAEAYINFLGGNRTFPVAAVMDDRRHRPWALKPGENAQYDDIGQMTLMRRNGLYLVSLDGEDTSQQSGGQTQRTQGQIVERMVSLRHVEKKKQDRPKKNQTGDQSNGTEHKHEGETVNTEIRATKKDIQILDGDTVVARYEKSSGQWTFTSKKIKIEATDTMEIKAKTMTIEATQALTIRSSQDVLDLFGKPIKLNGGGPSTPPFQVPG